METFKKVYIKSEEDLPKEDGYYIVHSSIFLDTRDAHFVNYTNDNYPEYDKKIWMDNYDWYLQPLPEQTEIRENLFERILDVSCIENLVSLTSNERHTVYDAFKTYLSQSHQMPNDDKIKVEIDARKTQKEQRGYGIKEVMLYIDGFQDAIKWFKSQIR